MFSRPRARSGFAAILIVAGLSAAGVAVRPAVGQDHPAPAAPAAPADSALEAHLMARLDSLRQDLDDLAARSRRRAGNAGSLEGLVVPLDTFMVRGIRVVTTEQDAATVRPWVQRAAEAIERRIGEIPDVTDPPTVRVDWAPFTAGFPPDAGTVRLRGQSADATDRAMRNAAAEVLARRLPDPVRAWLQSPVGVEAAPYTELAASPTWVVRECREGRTGACAVALGIDPLDTGSLTDAQRRELGTLRAGSRAPQPLSGGRLAFMLPGARRSFLQRLLRTRPGALTRLLTAHPAPDADLRALLEDAAGGSLDPILDAWREATLANRPTFLSASAVGATLLWILLFLAFATRSTRWRAG